LKENYNADKQLQMKTTHHVGIIGYLYGDKIKSIYFEYEGLVYGLVDLSVGGKVILVKKVDKCTSMI